MPSALALHWFVMEILGEAESPRKLTVGFIGFDIIIPVSDHIFWVEQRYKP